jgi:hypothetical protein
MISSGKNDETGRSKPLNMAFITLRRTTKNSQLFAVLFTVAFMANFSSGLGMTYFFKGIKDLMGAVLPRMLFTYSAQRILPHLVEFVKISAEEATDALSHALGVVVNDDANFILFHEAGDFAAVRNQHRAAVGEVVHKFDREGHLVIGNSPERDHESPCFYHLMGKLVGL